MLEEYLLIEHLKEPLLNLVEPVTEILSNVGEVRWRQKRVVVRGDLAVGLCKSKLEKRELAELGWLPGVSAIDTSSYVPGLRFDEEENTAHLFGTLVDLEEKDGLARILRIVRYDSADHWWMTRTVDDPRFQPLFNEQNALFVGPIIPWSGRLLER